jgi:hypothetical protein
MSTSQEVPHVTRYPSKVRCQVSRREQVLLRWYRRLNAEDRGHVMRFISVLALNKP